MGNISSSERNKSNKKLIKKHSKYAYRDLKEFTEKNKTNKNYENIYKTEFYWTNGKCTNVDYEVIKRLGKDYPELSMSVVDYHYDSSEDDYDEDNEEDDEDEGIVYDYGYKVYDKCIYKASTL